MSPTNGSPRVAVVGAGIGGLTLAIALRERGIHVDVYEQAPHLGEVGAAVAIAANGTRVLRELGIDPQMAACGAIPTEMQFRRWNTGELIAAHPMGDQYTERFGGPFYGIHRQDLQRILLERLGTEPLRLGHQVNGLRWNPDSVTLTFEGGGDAVADIVVGADGVHSYIRSVIHPDPPSARFAGQVGFRGLIPVDALPRLPDPEAAQGWPGPGAHMLHYPIHPDRDVVNFLAVVDKPLWEAPTWRQPCSVDEVLACFEGWHPAVREMIGAVKVDIDWWALHDFDPFSTWSAGRVVLIGDAAHAMQPHQGQGANQAIEDAIVLADELAATPTDPEVAVRGYLRRRRARTRNVQRYSRLAGALQHVTDDAQITIQEAALRNLDDNLSWIHSHDARAK